MTCKVEGSQIEKVFESYYTMQGLPFKGTDFSGRSDYGPFIAVGIPAGGLFTGAEGVKTAAEAELFGGTAGQPYDPCYHLACDTTRNLNNVVFLQNAQAMALARALYPQAGEHVLRPPAPWRWLAPRRLPLAAHALFARPLVVAPTSMLAIEVQRRTDGVGVLFCDGRRAHDLAPGARQGFGRCFLETLRTAEGPFRDPAQAGARPPDP